jgi:hypothetical protein
MKSNREAALTRRDKVKPRNVTMPKEAMKIAVRLETARNYKDKTRYNNILKKLADEYPDYAESIESLYWK